MLALAVRRAEHHQARPPPAVERILGERLLLGRPGRERQHDLVALALVEALLLADADHRPRIGSIGAAAERDLVHDRRAVDEPADGADVGPGQRRIVEDRGILGLAGQELVDHLLARHAERLGGGVEVEPVAALVLHLGEQRGLPLQRRRAGDPVALRQHADDLGMGVLGDLTDEGAPVGLGHPVVRLDALFIVDPRLEGGGLRRLLRAERLRDGIARVEGLSVHRHAPPEGLLASICHGIFQVQVFS